MLNTDHTKTFCILSLAAVFCFSCPVAADATFAFQDTLADKYNTDLYGFFEARQGFRTNDDPYEKTTSISEMRLQLDLSTNMGWGTFKFKGDLYEDLVEEKEVAELRELNLLFSPLSNLDLKVGRQVLTWGTGDLLFINDLFPKDWVSFFIGRDDEYLKAPSDAIKASIFFDAFSLDLVYMPLFTNSVYIDGSRLSYWNGNTIAGRNTIFVDDERLSVFDDDVVALRISKNISGAELALYGYHGFWTTPEGFNPIISKGTYPKLAAFGASIRSNLLGGIGSFEAGYYDSLDDQSGTDPLVRNSEIRLLAGYEIELAKNLTGGVQYYLEYMQDYDEYKSTLVSGPAKDELRHVFTMRLTKLLMNQNLRISLFTYFSSSDKDGYVRPKAHYKITDQWAAEIGGNIFFGDNSHTFFGQFEDNTNVYASIRWNF
jgi:hypothetical protein